MNNKTVFSRYFSTCASIILVSIAFIGIVFMTFAGNYFRKDKYDLLGRNLEQAQKLTGYSLSYNPLADKLYVTSDLVDYYRVIGKSVNSEIFLVDIDGDLVLSSDVEATPQKVPESIMKHFETDDSYTETGKLGGAFNKMQYTVGMTIPDQSGRVVGAVFATTDAGVLVTFLVDIFQMFVLSSAVVILFVFIIIYFITSNMVRPLQQMVQATHSFSKGDFSVRVPVEGDDEIALLAASFNSMASDLATLEQASRSFTANVSHELKTPMTTIGGFIDGILDGTIPPEKERHYLKIVSDEVGRLSRLVRSMLNISKIEAGELKITPVPVDITNIAINTALIFENKLEEKQIEVRGLDSDKFLVEADADLIHQVVYNLVDNAVKFVNQGGYLEFNYYTESGKTFTSIKNSGDGLTNEDIKRVFDRFYKTDKSRSLDKNGVGLGLYIVKTILSLHGGDIYIRSDGKSYTEFVFSLPTADQKKGRFKHFDKSSQETKEDSGTKAK